MFLQTLFFWQSFQILFPITYLYLLQKLREFSPGTEFQDLVKRLLWGGAKAVRNQQWQHTIFSTLWSWNTHVRICMPRLRDRANWLFFDSAPLVVLIQAEKNSWVCFSLHQSAFLMFFFFGVRACVWRNTRNEMSPSLFDPQKWYFPLTNERLLFQTPKNKLFLSFIHWLLASRFFFFFFFS